jgi:hypothetical protein
LMTTLSNGLNNFSPDGFSNAPDQVHSEHG